MSTQRFVWHEALRLPSTQSNRLLAADWFLFGCLPRGRVLAVLCRCAPGSAASVCCESWLHPPPALFRADGASRRSVLHRRLGGLIHLVLFGHRGGAVRPVR